MQLQLKVLNNINMNALVTVISLNEYAFLYCGLIC